MRSGRALRRKKTNLAQALKGTITVYSSQTVQIPYGANAVMIGGRGASGNPTYGGNVDEYGYAVYNPTLYGGNSYTDYYDSTNGWHDYSNNDNPWGPAEYAPSPFSYTANGNYPGYSVVNFNVDYSVSGNLAYYNPTYYNPEYPGNPGPTTVIGGITFPGGNSDSVAPVVNPQRSTFTYQQAGISITVPAGGYVTLQPID